ncbi:MAG: BlaI/MecI/CopY family transcriptional regulator [Acidobacteria bacterium]|nr:BlaI/MecI/CopY family transcriptional regulator [Acidobacteriota bacterium]
MEVIWVRGEARVWDVQEGVRLQRDLAYTTVSTVMDRLARKGALSRRKAGKAYVYRPTFSRSEALRTVTDAFIRQFFHGSRQALARFLSGSSPPVRPPAGPVAPSSRPSRPAPIPADEEMDPSLL